MQLTCQFLVAFLSHRKYSSLRPWHPGRPVMGFPGGPSGKESICQCRRCGFNPWVGKIPQRRKWQPTPVFLPGKCDGQRSLEGYSPQGHKRARHGLHPLFIFSVCVPSSDFLQPRVVQPARVLLPRHFPGRNTGVGCCFSSTSSLEGSFFNRDHGLQTRNTNV